MSILYASSEAQYGRETCLIDLDVQFGDIAFQLGLNPRLSLADLLEASGSRLDGSLIRATVTDHRSGLKVIAAPSEMMPLESVSSEHLLQIDDQAKKEFGTTFVELPTNWTNWSLSLVARSDLVLLITELSVAGLNRAKRQLDLLESQGLGALDIRVIVNRYEKAQSRTIRPADVKAALGRDIAYTVSNDFALVRSAIDRGVPLTEVKRKNAISKDLQLLDSGIAAGLGLER
jgi:pilus assembly protein CpaE